MADIWLIRHGQAGALMGDYDLLSERGQEQARLAGARWGHLSPVHHVVSGAMRRHRETAACFAEGFGGEGGALPPAAVDEDWNEFDHQSVIRAAMAAGLAPPSSGGRTEGFRWFLEAMGRWSDGDHDEDYTEPYARFQRRVVGALARVEAGLGKGERALVFTSGGVISAVCRELLGLEPRVAFRVNTVLVNTGFTRVLVGGGGASLASLNVYPHLDAEPELVTLS